MIKISGKPILGCIIINYVHYVADQLVALMNYLPCVIKHTFAIYYYLFYDIMKDMRNHKAMLHDTLEETCCFC